MAKRRMFLCEILQSDDFFTLPPKSQMLYIHLNMEADDDGLLGNPQSVARYLKIPNKYLVPLIEKGYIISFDSGVIAIAHWLLHNKIRKDRYTQTRFLRELSMLKIRHNIYQKICQSETGQGIPDFFDNQNATQGKAMEERKEKDSINQSILSKSDECTACETDGQSSEKDSYERLSYTDRLTYAERTEYNNFLNELKIFYFKEYKDTKVTEFIEEYEGRNWFNTLGEYIRDNYKPELKKWRMRRESAKTQEE